ncbi:MAG: amidohydrolase family protein [Verrucomicrobiales bacterium]
MPATLYRSAQIASENAAPKSGDVLVEGGKIAAVGDSLAAPEGAEVIDCAGLILLPGLFDPHVHFREPGQEHKENIKTGSEAAINGGVTGVVAMPNTAPSIDTGGMVKTVLESAERSCRIDFYTSGCITKGARARNSPASPG